MWKSPKELLFSSHRVGEWVPTVLHPYRLWTTISSWDLCCCSKVAQEPYKISPCVRLCKIMCFCVKRGFLRQQGTVLSRKAPSTLLWGEKKSWLLSDEFDMVCSMKTMLIAILKWSLFSCYQWTLKIGLNGRIPDGLKHSVLKKEILKLFWMTGDVGTVTIFTSIVPDETGFWYFLSHTRLL